MLLLASRRVAGQAEKTELADSPESASPCAQLNLASRSRVRGLAVGLSANWRLNVKRTIHEAQTNSGLNLRYALHGAQHGPANISKRVCGPPTTTMETPRERREPAQLVRTSSPQNAPPASADVDGPEGAHVSGDMVDSAILVSIVVDPDPRSAAVGGAIQPPLPADCASEK
jgi:hypothetical protein